MTRPLAFTLLAATLALFYTGCAENDQPAARQRRTNRFGYKPGVDPAAQTTQDAPPVMRRERETTSDTTDTVTTDTPPPPPSHTEERTTTTTSGPAPKKDYPYATPVAGKSGFVTSPYAPYSGYVDVRGFPPGTEVKDPYTQKIFLVP